MEDPSHYGVPSVDLSLNEEQRQAVTAEILPLLMAGAGSGKTRVLTERIAWLLEERHASPSEILAITFTRKAARELRDRLAARLGNRARAVTACTFHALGLRELKRLGDVLGLRPDRLTVYSPWETDYLIRDVVQEMGRSPELAALRESLARYDQTGEEPGPEDGARHCELFNAFLARCRENNAVTFGGLVNGLRLLLRHCPQYLPWRYVLVDEAQDMDSLQWAVATLGMAVQMHAEVTLVGDISQSIYEWRGARPDQMFAFSSTGFYSTLRNNYRSAPAIVDAANRLVSRNVLRLPLDMIASGGEVPGSGVEVLRYCDSTELANRVCFDLSSGYGPAEIAVLSRTHALVDKPVRLLQERGVPAVHVGDAAKLTETGDFRRFTAFLKLMVNPFDNFSFLLARELLGIGDQEYRQIRVDAASQGLSHFQAWAAAAQGDARDRLAEPSADLLQAVHFARALAGPESQEAFLYALDWAEAHAGTGVADYLEWLATVDVQDELDAGKEPAVILSTIHAAKGLEWRKVYVFGCNEGLLPSGRAVTRADLESERRLAYVAWTRARENLVLCILPPGGRCGGPSRFLAESGL